VTSGARSSAVALAAMLHAAPVAAQLSGSIAAVSDYRYRGVTLSDGDPAVQGTFVYDAAGGGYAGAFGSTARPPGDSSVGVQLVTFAGFAAPSGASMHWDAGGTYSAFSSGRDYDYGELYAGLGWGIARMHVYWSPRYFGSRHRTLYAEVDASGFIAQRVRCAVHVGALWAFGATAYEADVPRGTPDARLGLATDLESVTAEVWLAARLAGAGGSYARADAHRRSTLGVTLSHAF
jgi:uncharacterized protein (TIGR02001 family)